MIRYESKVIPFSKIEIITCREITYQEMLLYRLERSVKFVKKRIIILTNIFIITHQAIMPLEITTLLGPTPWEQLNASYAINQVTQQKLAGDPV